MANDFCHDVFTCTKPYGASLIKETQISQLLGCKFHEEEKTVAHSLTKLHVEYQKVWKGKPLWVKKNCSWVSHDAITNFTNEDGGGRRKLHEILAKYQLLVSKNLGRKRDFIAGILYWYTSLKLKMSVFSSSLNNFTYFNCIA